MKPVFRPRRSHFAPRNLQFAAPPWKAGGGRAYSSVTKPNNPLPGAHTMSFIQANGPTIAYEISGIDTEVLIDQSRGVVAPPADKP